MPDLDFSNMSEEELVELAKQIQKEIENFKDKKLDKARQTFFKACDEVTKAGGTINYYGGLTGQSNVYSMDKRYIYIE
jgi:hypothetical protein